MAIDLIGGRQYGDDAVRQLRDGVIVERGRHDHGKFVAADPPAKFLPATGLAQAARDFAQQFIANLMAQRIVDRLEPIEIDHQESAAGAARACGGHGLVQHFAQMATVGQASQRIEPRQLRDLVRRFALQRYVRCDPAKAQERAIVVMPGRGGQFPPACLARHLDRQHQIGKALAPLEMIGQAVQSGGEASAFPGAARQYLNQRHALQLFGRQSQRLGKTLGCAVDAAHRVGLPQPIRAAFFIFAQQQADHFGFFRQLRGAAMLVRECARIDEAASEQRERIAGRERVQRQLQAVTEHGEQAADEG